MLAEPWRRVAAAVRGGKHRGVTRRSVDASHAANERSRNSGDSEALRAAKGGQQSERQEPHVTCKATSPIWRSGGAGRMSKQEKQRLRIIYLGGSPPVCANE